MHYQFFLVCAIHKVWSWFPPIGVFIAVLGLLGVLVPLYRDLGKISKREKAIWTSIMFMLLLLEIRSIYLDRKQHDKEQAEARTTEVNHFKAIADGITGAIQQDRVHFDATMTQSNKIVTSLSDSINLQTGANGYIYFDVMFIGGPIEADVPGAPFERKGSMIVSIFPRCVGKFPLHNVFVSAMGPPGRLGDVDYGTFFCGEIGRPRQSLTLVFNPDVPKQHFNIFINASNGSYQQVIVIKQQGEQWLWACRFWKVGIKKPLRMWSISQFPKEELEGIWDDY
jgi:hypothetical protein